MLAITIDRGQCCARSMGSSWVQILVPPLRCPVTLDVSQHHLSLAWVVYAEGWLQDLLHGV